MKKSLLRRIARFLRPYGAKLLLLVILMVVSNLLALTAPMLSGWAVDAVGTEALAIVGSVKDLLRRTVPEETCVLNEHEKLALPDPSDLCVRFMVVV